MRSPGDFTGPRIRCLALVTLLLAAGCSGPTGFFSGGALEGVVAPWPERVENLGTEGIGQLETHPDDPYSVNIAWTVVDGHLYINAGDTETQWVQYLEADPRARLRIEGTIYEGQATRVHDANEIARFGQHWVEQGPMRRDPAALDRVWVYRLSARAAL